MHVCMCYQSTFSVRTLAMATSAHQAMLRLDMHLQNPFPPTVLSTTSPTTLPRACTIHFHVAFTVLGDHDVTWKELCFE